MNSDQKVKDIGDMFSQIQSDFKCLSSDDAGIVQLFFDPKISIYEISQIYELSAENVEKVIYSFMMQLFAKSKMLLRFLSSSYPAGENGKVDFERQVNQLIKSCSNPESVGGRIREIIGTAIQTSIPPISSQVWSEVISKVESITKSYQGRIKKFPVKLEEQDFILGRLRIAADGDNGNVNTGKTYSSGTVFVERGDEIAEVKFYISMQEAEEGEYSIRFNNLPAWAVPFSFSFVVADETDIEKEYMLESECREDALYIKVENPEQEIAFLDRKETFIGFIIDELPSE